MACQLKNPYAKRRKKQITINIDNDTVDFFKEQSDKSGIPYQTLINLYLSDCAWHKKQLQISWENSLRITNYEKQGSNWLSDTSLFLYAILLESFLLILIIN